MVVGRQVAFNALRDSKPGAFASVWLGHVRTRQRVAKLAPGVRLCIRTLSSCAPAMLLRSLARPALISRQLPRHSTILTRAMSVRHIDNTTQLDGILSKSKDKLSVRRAKRFGFAR